MKMLQRIRSQKAPARYLALFGLGLILFAASGSNCLQKDREVDIVATVEVTQQFHAQGSTNVYSDAATVDLSSEIDLQQILSDNDIESLDTLLVEAVFYKVLTPDPNPARSVTANIFTVKAAAADAPQNLFTVSGPVTVNDPALASWQVAPLTAGGMGVINAALEKVRRSAPAPVYYQVAGTSDPAGTTNFWWEVMVRLHVVGKRKLTIYAP